MDSFYFLIIGIVLGAAAGWGLSLSRRPKSDSSFLALEKDLASAQATIQGKVEIISRLESELFTFKDRDSEERALLAQFEPLREQMEKLGADVHRKELAASEAFAEIKTQLETAERTDAQLKNQTAALANALAKPGGKGSWGELTLERLLESLGMHQNLDFIKKMHLAPDQDDPAAKERIPDFVITLPKERYVVVDSKVPYTNYLAAMDAEDEVTNGDFTKRDALLKKYIEDIKSHVNELATKQYYTGLSSTPEFTVLYMPNEPALAVALRVETSLMEYAFQRKIVLVTPSSFYAVMKTVSHIWSRSEDQETIAQVFKLGQEILRQARLLAGDIVNVRKGLRTATDGFNDMTKRLNGSFIDAARNLGQNHSLSQAAGILPDLESLDVQLNDLTAKEFKELPPSELE